MYCADVRTTVVHQDEYGLMHHERKCSPCSRMHRKAA
ncbi:MAG: hypothetical protein BWX88_02062 [Planctomycetes bacterium ADurb.Bin126]|nr:MAG: hypothetical protein BWX88_02062 [Planctomycetes bacterium ADurb.Bin126]